MKKENSAKKATAPSIAEEPLMAYQAAAPHNNAIAMMGMQKNTRFKEIQNDNDFIEVIREGIPKEAMNNLMALAEISLQEMSDITHISDRTLRRYESKDKLPQEQSERVIELAKLYSRGSEVFGGLSNFKEWMSSKLMPLGGKKPKEFLDTSLGIDLLMKELGRIEHGIFA